VSKVELLRIANVVPLPRDSVIDLPDGRCGRVVGTRLAFSGAAVEPAQLVIEVQVA
jgi:hypothetical protein